MVFGRRRRSSAASTSSSSNTRSPSSSTTSSSSSADLRRSSFGIASPVANWRARKHQAVTYRPAVWFTPSKMDDYVMMVPGRQVQNVQPRKGDSLNGWKGVTLLGDSGRVEYEPN
ncbi:expressed unknown protein [Seminavis robusta]|uniref:Uncharacterized protein n=1 Tax=Seminavis robusta TaxID=568900 RepID=A0A9N8HU17_9STRA|nr:expressed unknown protein [Seminavis robusta]|eukprot:Sro1978_g309030.1 n/a (115) ;mRNA; f:7997-8341